jgi:hypothetical protein
MQVRLRTTSVAELARRAVRRRQRLDHAKGDGLEYVDTPALSNGWPGRCSSSSLGPNQTGVNRVYIVPWHFKQSRGQATSFPEIALAGSTQSTAADLIT